MYQTQYRDRFTMPIQQKHQIAKSLANKSLTMMLSVDKPIEVISVPSDTTATTSNFSRHFKTTANAYSQKRWEYYEKQKERHNHNNHSFEDSWKNTKTRAPSWCFRERTKKKTIFEYDEDIRVEARFNNFTMNTDVHKKSIPLLKQTWRKEWMHLPTNTNKTYDCAEAYNKLRFQSNQCYVNYDKVVCRNRSIQSAKQDNYDHNKAMQAVFDLKPNRNKTNLDFNKQTGRQTLSPYQKRNVNNSHYVNIS